jgi:hypothetical protein
VDRNAGKFKGRSRTRLSEIFMRLALRAGISSDRVDGGETSR